MNTGRRKIVLQRTIIIIKCLYLDLIETHVRTTIKGHNKVVFILETLEVVYIEHSPTLFKRIKSFKVVGDITLPQNMRQMEE